MQLVSAVSINMTTNGKDSKLVAVVDSSYSIDSNRRENILSLV